MREEKLMDYLRLACQGHKNAAGSGELERTLGCSDNELRKFLLSYNDCDFIRDLYDASGIQIDAYTRINNIKQRYDNGAQFPEILIANYDMQERSRNAPAQMNLFDAGLAGLMPGEED